jgi:hypothetical protein
VLNFFLLFFKKICTFAFPPAIKSFMRKNFALALFLGHVVICITPSVAQTENSVVSSAELTRAYLPDSGASFIPPIYFNKINQEGALAFIHPGAFASVQLRVVDGIPYTRISESVNEETMNPQGVQVLVREDLTTLSGAEAVMFLLSYTVESTENETPINFERLMLFTGTYQMTVWIEANYPVQARSLLYNVLRESLLSVEFQVKSQ